MIRLLLAFAFAALAPVVHGQITFTLDKTEFAPGEDIVATWSGNDPGTTSEWIGIYPRGVVPDGDPGSTDWYYLNNTRDYPAAPITSGSVTFNSPNITEGDWTAHFLLADGYSQGATPVDFTVVNTQPVILDFFADWFIADGTEVNFYWTIDDKGVPLTSLTLDDGVSAPIDVLGLTEYSLVPPLGENTTYTLVLNGGADSASFAISGAAIATFGADSQFAEGGPVTLSWFLDDGGGSIPIDSLTIEDGSNPPIDVRGQTSLEVNPATTTQYTLNLNNGADTALLTVFVNTGNTANFSLDKTVYAAGEPIVATWANVAGGPTDWVGLYKVGDFPGPVPSTDWNYLNGTRTSGGSNPAGSMTFAALPAGEYFAALLLNDVWEIAEGPLRFTVSLPPTPPLRITNLAIVGNQVTLTWDSDPTFFATYAIEESDGLATFAVMPDETFIFSDGITTTYTFTRPDDHGSTHFYRVVEESF